MRISTVTMYEQSVSAMNRQQGDFLKVGQQIATGRRVVNPSDDPQAASRAVGVSQAKAITQQFDDARVSARNSLAQAESVMNSVSDGIISAKTLLIQASSDTLSDVDRQAVASELRGIYETLIGQANATDGNGRYLFGGFQDSLPPFTREGGDGAIVYVGDGNVREQRIDASRLMPVTNNGIQVFQSVASGAGYMAEAGRFDANGVRTEGNEGNVTFKALQTLDRNDPAFGQTFTLSFDADTTPPTYTVMDGDSVVIATGDYESGKAITFGPLSLTLDGNPATGDSIRVGQAREMNTDLFRSFEKALAVLENPAETPAQRAEMRNTLNTVMREFDNSLDNVLTVRASMGARLNELDVVDAVSGNRMMNYDQTLSDLIDLDYAQAIGEYSLRQVGLQAAQKAFVDVKSLSLFKFL
ncbi:MAG: flagellar hook-associated protein FlgL [Halomonas sp.]|nr:flagellar hook-associated protein FlgL [Halomonas sp.]MCC5881515.1 flagellar hook-associated protein FlgL [Halomonas sp.]